VAKGCRVAARQLWSARQSGGAATREKLRLVPVATRHDHGVYWVLLYDLVDDYLDRRGPFRGVHLAAAAAAVERGELVLAGALADPADSAILVFQGEDSSAAERFAAGDPYVQNGLVRSFRVRRWTVVVGVGVTPPADVVGPT
jgi:uncharacterized protein YciI